MGTDMRKGPRRRYAYAVGYLLMACAGVAAAYWPAPTVKTATAGVSVFLYVWDVFLIFGGSFSAYGAFTDRWVGEYLGLPLLFSVFAVYGVSAAAASVASERPASVAGAFALTAIAFLIVGRWRELTIVRRNASEPPPPGGGSSYG